MGLDVDMVGRGGLEAADKERKDSVGAREKDFEIGTRSGGVCEAIATAGGDGIGCRYGWRRWCGSS